MRCPTSRPHCPDSHGDRTCSTGCACTGGPVWLGTPAAHEALATFELQLPAPGCAALPGCLDMYSTRPKLVEQCSKALRQIAGRRRTAEKGSERPQPTPACAASAPASASASCQRLPAMFFFKAETNRGPEAGHAPGLGHPVTFTQPWRHTCYRHTCSRRVSDRHAHRL